LTRERLANSNFKIVSQYCAVEKEITVYDDTRMTVGKAIENGLVKERDYLQFCDSEMITVRTPKKVKQLVGYQEYKKVVRAAGFNALKSGSSGNSDGNDDDDDQNNKIKTKDKKYHLNSEKLQDRPYEVSFAANNSRSLLDSLEVSENSSLWSWLNKQLPFELTTTPIQPFYAIVKLKLVQHTDDVSSTVLLGETGVKDQASNGKKSKHEPTVTTEVVVAGKKLLTNVYVNKGKGISNEVENPLGHLTILGTVGKNQLLVVNNNDKKKKKFVIDKPQTAFMPPTVEVKYIFLVHKCNGDMFDCVYVNGDGEEYNVHLNVPFNVQKTGIVRDFVLWLPDSVDVINK